MADTSLANQPRPPWSAILSHWSTTVGVPATLAMATAVAIGGWGLAESMGAVSARLEGQSEQLTKIETALLDIQETLADQRIVLDRLDTRLAALEGVSADLATEQADLVRRVDQAETNPQELLTEMGFAVNRDIAAVWIGGDLVALPQTAQAQRALEDAGYRLVQVTPYLEGWVRAEN